MLDNGRVRSNLRHARPGFAPVAGHNAIVGCEDARPAVAKILSVDEEAAIEVQVLPGTVEGEPQPPAPGPVPFGAAGGGER